MALVKKLTVKNTVNDFSYPFSVPAINNLRELDLDHDIVIFVGDNGAGKSTLMEIMAVKLNLYRISEDLSYRDQEFTEIKQSSNKFKLDYVSIPKGFFFRSEDFISYIRFLEKTKKEAELELKRINYEYQDKSNFAKALASMPHHRTLSDIDNMYNNPLLQESHGESYLDFFKSRLRKNNLYLLDEAEMPLSIQNQLTLLLLIKEAIADGCQFIISTHSPILMSFPNACLYEISGDGINKTKYEDIESVKLLKGFLNDKENYIRHLFID